MAKLNLEDKEFELPDGTPIKATCMEFGIPFGCENGICATCMIKILEGKENLSKKTEAEEAMEFESDDIRLACQCKIEKGTVKAEQYFM